MRAGDDVQGRAGGTAADGGRPSAGAAPHGRPRGARERPGHRPGLEGRGPAPAGIAGPAAVPAATGGARGEVTVTADGLPEWLHPVVRIRDTVGPTQLSRFLPPPVGGRPSAVLVLFGEGADGPELLLMERSGTLRSHAGQPAFPGGALDPEDGDPATTGPLRAALREAEEETGLDPSGVQVFGALPRLYIPVSGFVVTPVLGWWRTPSPVDAVDPAETARVFTVPVADLTDPANRATALHPSGHLGPAFSVQGALVWGFTAGVIDRILHYAGWERPWDRDRRVPLERYA
jgi:8-oxo-dGTP pyrophosphatase MutT (NUDIX family)